MAIHPTVVEIVQAGSKWWTSRLTMPSIEPVAQLKNFTYSALFPHKSTDMFNRFKAGEFSIRDVS